MNYAELDEERPEADLDPPFKRRPKPKRLAEADVKQLDRKLRSHSN